MSSYLHTHKSEPKIPGVLVFIVLGVFVVGLVSLFKPQTRIVTQDSSVLERVDVANVRDSTVTIYWRTRKPTSGYIIYGSAPDDLSMKAYDARDVQNNLKLRQNHVTTMSNVTGESVVYYKIVIDETPLGQTAEVPYSVKTARKLNQPREEEPLTGTVARMDGTQESQAIVIAHISGAQPLLTQTNADGTFLISLCCVYDESSGEPMSLDPQSKIRFEIISENGMSLLVQSQLRNSQPMSAPILVDAPITPEVREVVDASTTQETSSQSQSPEANAPEVLAVSDSTIGFQDIDIIYPRDGGVIPGSRPLIKGFGEPGMEVKGTLSPENRLFQVTVDEDRYWMYEPSFEFSAGEHELKVETLDSQGKKYSLTRAFTILKSGEAVLGDATASATLTPSPTIEVTATPSATAVPSSTPPVSGVNILPLSMLSLLLIVIGAGIVLLF